MGTLAKLVSWIGTETAPAVSNTRAEVWASQRVVGTYGSSYAPMSAQPIEEFGADKTSVKRGLPTTSVAVAETTLLLPTSMHGEVDCRLTSLGYDTNLGSLLMFPVPP